MISQRFVEDSIKVNIGNKPLYIIREFFNESTLNEITEEVKRLQNDRSGWSKGYLQEDLSRKQYEAFKSNLLTNIKDYLNTDIFFDTFYSLTKCKISNVTFNLWWDTYKYTLPMHFDNEAVKLAMQIYIGDDYCDTLGTSFGDKDQNVIFTLPYIKNTGYFLQNPNEVNHGLIGTVPENFNRFSLYFYIS